MNVANNLYYVSIIPDRYGSVPIFISDRNSVSIGTYFFRHDFRDGEGLERSDSESDRRLIDPLRKDNGNTSGTIIGYHFEFK